MKRFFACLLAPTLAVSILAGCGANAADPPFTGSGKLQICASFYVMADFTQKLAGDRAEVFCLASGGEPHDWEPTPRDLTALEQADILVLNGGGLEHWAEDVLPTLQNAELTVVTTRSDEWTQWQRDGSDHSNSDDPHYWLDPLKAKSQLAAIAETLIQRDPDGAEVYRQNLGTALAEADLLNQEYEGALGGLSRREIVVSHAAFGHLCARYKLEQIAVQGLSPEGEPDPAQMAKVIRQVAECGATVIFFEEQASPKVAETIARETGATTAVLDPLELLSAERIAAGEDYFSVMRQNLTELEAALK